MTERNEILSTLEHAHAKADELAQVATDTIEQIVAQKARIIEGEVSLAKLVAKASQLNHELDEIRKAYELLEQKNNS